MGIARICRAGQRAGMKPIVPLLLALSLSALAACSAGGPGATPQQHNADNDLCLASTWRGRFIGTTRDQAQFEIGPLIREGKARIIESGQGRSERPDRLTFEMGRDGRVARIWCG